MGQQKDLIFPRELLMCGIIGYSGKRNTASVLTKGLKRLKYRGYGSAGIAVFHDNRIEIRRTEGYPAGEMKHGPIALIDREMPVVVLVARDSIREKVMGNVEEFRARDGIVIAVASGHDQEIRQKADEVISIPDTSPLLTPILFTIPLQLLAYYAADFKGNDVDQPRNLARSVTVE
jgi:glucosamine 6-phosphate synthetase-like amidotransferase/phosphosugar isomerase protein